MHFAEQRVHGLPDVAHCARRPNAHDGLRVESCRAKFPVHHLVCQRSSTASGCRTPLCLLLGPVGRLSRQIILIHSARCPLVLYAFIASCHPRSHGLSGDVPVAASISPPRLPVGATQRRLPPPRHSHPPTSQTRVSETSHSAGAALHARAVYLGDQLTTPILLLVPQVFALCTVTSHTPMCSTMGHRIARAWPQPRPPLQPHHLRGQPRQPPLVQQRQRSRL